MIDRTIDMFLSERTKTVKLKFQILWMKFSKMEVIRAESSHVPGLFGVLPLYCPPCFVRDLDKMKTSRQLRVYIIAESFCIRQFVFIRRNGVNFETFFRRSHKCTVSLHTSHIIQKSCTKGYDSTEFTTCA